MNIIRRIADSIRNFLFYWSYYHLDINSNSVIFECYSEQGVSNLMACLIELVAKIGNKQVYLSVDGKWMREVKEELLSRRLGDVHFIRRGSLQYCMLLETAQWLFTDYVFPDWYVKRKGQLLVSAWNRCPEEDSAKNSAVQFNQYDMIQRNLLMADILYGASEESLNTILNSYGLSKLFRGKLLWDESASYHAVSCRQEISKITMNKLFRLINSATTRNVSNPLSENVLIYGGDLDKNGITTSLNNLLNALDDGREYYILYRRNQLANKRHNLNNLKDAKYLGISGVPFLTPLEMIFSYAFVKLGIRNRMIEFYYYRMISREYERQSIDGLFGYYIQFSGYESYIISMFQKSKGIRSIFVHNNMPREIRTKANQSKNVLHDAYTQYDHVAVVAEALIGPTKSIGGDNSRICLVENIIDRQSILERANKEISIQNHTALSINDVNELHAILNNSSVVIVTIGRFSEEKQHSVLIDAFELFADNYEGALLVIIGGYGRLYDETVEKAHNCRHSDQIILIKNIDNPIPILNKCNLFVLSSKYEGQPVVFYEAAALNKPIIGTRAPGIKEFLERYNGYISENSIEGLYNAFVDFVDGKVGPIQIEFDSLKEIRLNQFESLFESRQ